MLIQATYDDGRLEFDRPVQFARRRFIVRVEVPDQELVQPDASNQTVLTSDPQFDRQTAVAAAGASLPAEANRWLTRLETLRVEAIPGQRGQPGTLSDAQLERLDAFATREDRCLWIFRSTST